GLSISALAGCQAGDESGSGSGGDPGKPAFDYPLDDVLRLDPIQVKATHNSYHIQPADMSISALNYTRRPLGDQLAEEGVRGLELDIHFNYALKQFEVYHIPKIDEGTTCRRFVDCLE